MRRPPARLKWTYVTRNVGDPSRLDVGPVPTSPSSGDLVVCRVRRVGAPGWAEDGAGRRMRLYPGDQLVGARGPLPAGGPGSPLALVGRSPEPDDRLLTTAGVVGPPAGGGDDGSTELEVVGSVVGPGGRPLSCQDFARVPGPEARPPLGTVAVLGVGADPAPTTRAIVRGWSRAGLRPGAGKLTGICLGSDRWAYLDAGATAASEFLDFGLPSTLGCPPERLCRTMVAIRDELANARADVVALELAEGILRPDTFMVVERLAMVADAVVLVAADAPSAAAGLRLLADLALPVAAVTGPVAVIPPPGEADGFVLAPPVLSRADLADGAALRLLWSLAAADGGRRRGGG